jgi:metal-responsive CopG/Arc/MetJ family transcriptional regulator
MLTEEKYGYKIVTINIPNNLLERIDKKRITPNGEIKRSPFIVNKLKEIFDINESKDGDTSAKEGQPAD